MTIDQLKYPVILISRNCIEISTKRDEIATCSSHALKSGYYEGLLLVDSSGCCYQVANAQPKRVVSSFWQSLINKRYEVSITLAEPGTAMTAETLKALLKSRLESNPEFASAIKAGDIDVSTIDQATTIDGIFRTIKEWYSLESTLIIADDHGDILVFASYEEAIDYIEAIDVRDQEYIFYDEDGFVLHATVVDDEIRFIRTTDNRLDDLVTSIRKFLKRIRSQEILDTWIESASSQELIAKAKEFS